MKRTWFTHEPMTTEEANQLLDRYKIIAAVTPEVTIAQG